LASAEDHLTLIKSLIELPDTGSELNQRLNEMKPLLQGSESATVLADALEARVKAQQGDESGARAAIERALKAHSELQKQDTL
ncbi:hypothetical protein ABTF75_19190, partial [Acinetobacter baumannii]